MIFEIKNCRYDPEKNSIEYYTDYIYKKIKGNYLLKFGQKGGEVCAFLVLAGLLLVVVNVIPQMPKNVTTILLIIALSCFIIGLISFAIAVIIKVIKCDDYTDLGAKLCEKEKRWIKAKEEYYEAYTELIEAEVKRQQELYWHKLFIEKDLKWIASNFGLGAFATRETFLKRAQETYPIKNYK